MKKTLSIILVVVMLMAIMPAAFAAQYQITFDAGAHGTIDSGASKVLTTGEDGKLSAAPDVVASAGYVFTGWSPAFDAETAYTANSSHTAQYAAVYTITFDPNLTGATVTPTSAVTGADGKLTSLPTPTPPSANYVFAGWYDASSGGNVVDNTKTYSAAQTIYAHWTATQTVTFNGNGNTGGSMSAQTVPYNTATPLNANAFTKTGCDFNGWKDSASNTYADGASVTLTSDLELTAQWTPKTYNITTETDGNGTLTAPATAKYGETVTLTATPKEGYIFDGWTVTGGATITDSKLTMPASDVTVKASFKVKPAFSSTYYASVSSPSRAVITSASTKVIPAGDSYTFAAKVTASGYYIGRVYVDGVNAGSPYLDTTTGVYYYTVNNKDTSAKTHTVVFNVYDSKGVPVTGDAGIWNYVVTMAASATAAAGIIIGKNKKK